MVDLLIGFRTGQSTNQPINIPHPCAAFSLPALALSLLLLVASTATVSRLEERNSFCASCHTPLEVRYVDQAEAATVDLSPNLAAYHFAASRAGDETVNCVACHRGDNGLIHRGVALGLGGLNTVKWILGDDGSQAGAHGVAWLYNAGCEGCHVDALSRDEFENHYHTYLAEYHADPAVAAVIAETPANRIQCSDCHLSHVDTYQEFAFLEDGPLFDTCEKCHLVWGRGPQGQLR